MEMLTRGSLFVVGTPIGNYQDVSFRMIDILKKSSLIICENREEAEKFLFTHAIFKPMVSAYTFSVAIKQAHKALRIGQTVALISDHGMPCVSDPGAEIVKHFRSLKVRVSVVPGPSAVSAAFSLSGFTSGFIFHGFLPKNKASIGKVLKDLLKKTKYNLIFFESSKRIQETLQIMADLEIKRTVKIMKDLTKPFEDIMDIDLKRIPKREIKGECVILIEKE